MLDVKSGAVLAMASVPTYDANMLLSDDRSSYWLELQRDSGLPMFNRALQGKYAPGSAFKPVTLLAALGRGVTTPDEVYDAKGFVEVSGTIFRDWTVAQGLAPAGPVDAAMGLRVMSIDLLNCGEEPYTVQGYPIIRVLDDDQQPLDVSILEGTAAIAGGIEPSDGPPQPVTADPGEHILAFVAWRNTVTDVSPITGHYLEVAPANGQSPQTVTPNGGIDLGTTGRLATGPWRTPQTS